MDFIICFLMKLKLSFKSTQNAPSSSSSLLLSSQGWLASVLCDSKLSVGMAFEFNSISTNKLLSVKEKTKYTVIRKVPNHLKFDWYSDLICRRFQSKWKKTEPVATFSEITYEDTSIRIAKWQKL